MPTIDASTRFLRRIDVEHVTGLSCSTIFAQVAAGRFPKPVRISANKNGWLESEVLAWMAARLAERDGASEATA